MSEFKINKIDNDDIYMMKATIEALRTDARGMLKELHTEIKEVVKELKESIKILSDGFHESDNKINTLEFRTKDNKEDIDNIAKKVRDMEKNNQKVEIKLEKMQTINKIIYWICGIVGVNTIALLFKIITDALGD